MLIVWCRRTSSNVQAVMWCIDELDLDVTRHDVGHVFGGTDTADFISMNPNQTIPVLRDQGGPALWETGAILRYLASSYAPDAFWPNGSAARAAVDKWAEWAKINVAMAFTGPVFWRVVRTSPQDRDLDAIHQAVAALEVKLRIAEDQLSRHAYLAGDELTLADIQFGHVLFRYFDIAIDRANLPALRAYYDRLSRREAYRRNVMISYDVLRVD